MTASRGAESRPEAIEAGRKLFAGPCDFFFAAAKSDGLPPIGAPEIAFAGRSNVGKSSLINALTGRSALARTSNTPGRTQELIFFALGGRLDLVDMPGYGYAAVAKDKSASWGALVARLSARPAVADARLRADRRPARRQGQRRGDDEDARRRRGVLRHRADQARRGEGSRPDARASPRRSKRCASTRPPIPRRSSPRPAPARASRNCAPISPNCSPNAACRRDRRSRPARQRLVAAISTPPEEGGQRPRPHRAAPPISIAAPIFCPRAPCPALPRSTCRPYIGCEAAKAADSTSSGPS